MASSNDEERRKRKTKGTKRTRDKNMLQMRLVGNEWWRGRRICWCVMYSCGVRTAFLFKQIVNWQNGANGKWRECQLRWEMLQSADRKRRHAALAAVLAFTSVSIADTYGRVHLSVCLSFFPSSSSRISLIYLSSFLSVCPYFLFSSLLSVCLSFFCSFQSHLSICLSVLSSFCLPFFSRISLHLSFLLSFFPIASIYLSICLSVYRVICLSVCPYFFLPSFLSFELQSRMGTCWIVNQLWLHHGHYSFVMAVKHDKRPNCTPQLP